MLNSRLCLIALSALIVWHVPNCINLINGYTLVLHQQNNWRTKRRRTIYYWLWGSVVQPARYIYIYINIFFFFHRHNYWSTIFYFNRSTRQICMILLASFKLSTYIYTYIHTYIHAWMTMFSKSNLSKHYKKMSRTDTLY